MSHPSECVRRVVIQRLASLERSGVQTVGRRLQMAPSELPTTEVSPTAQEGISDSNLQDAASMGGNTGRRRLLAELQQEVAGCTACAELARTRTQTVFGVGDPNARLCFFGEAPGADEDKQGEPFVGRAGRLLTDIIEKGMGLQRAEVYILNTIKCRPPGNRNPAAPELENCRHFFERQFELIDPEYICCLGTVAAQTLLETKLSIGRLRGELHDYRGIPVLCTYHPAYLLRNPAAKKDTWADIQILMREMGLS